MGWPYRNREHHTKPGRAGSGRRSPAPPSSARGCSRSPHPVRAACMGKFRAASGLCPGACVVALRTPRSERPAAPFDPGAVVRRVVACCLLLVAARRSARAARRSAIGHGRSVVGRRSVDGLVVGRSVDWHVRHKVAVGRCRSPSVAVGRRSHWSVDRSVGWSSHGRQVGRWSVIRVGWSYEVGWACRAGAGALRFRGGPNEDTTWLGPDKERKEQPRERHFRTRRRSVSEHGEAPDVGSSGPKCTSCDSLSLIYNTSKEVTSRLLVGSGLRPTRAGSTLWHYGLLTT